MSATGPSRTVRPAPRSPGPQRLAIALALAGALVIGIGLASGLGEFGLVVGLFLIFLAGGVLNWDRRSGH